MMYDLVAKAWSNGLLHSPKPWSQLGKVKFLCPCPGYDRHFRITQSFGIELIPIAMTDDGPDMEQVEQWISEPAVKGMWCVPKYSNPDGIIYSAETIRRIRQRFRLPPGMTVNRETPALLSPGDMELLREVERRGFVQVRFK